MYKTTMRLTAAALALALAATAHADDARDEPVPATDGGIAGETSSDAAAASGAVGATAGPGASARAGASRSSVPAPTRTRAGAASRHTSADFARLDANRDGRLTQFELASQADLSGRLATIDSDDDATLTQEEWDRFVLSDGED
jgi:hypothetical protein